MRAFLLGAAARGFEVELLFGDPEWTTSHNAPVQYLRSTMALCGDGGDALIAARLDSDLPMSTDIPTWFDRTPAPRGQAPSLSDWVQRRVDGVVVMACIRELPVLFEACEKEVQTADAIDRELTVGLQLDCEASPFITIRTRV